MTKSPVRGLFCARREAAVIIRIARPVDQIVLRRGGAAAGGAAPAISAVVFVANRAVLRQAQHEREVGVGGVLVLAGATRE